MEISVLEKNPLRAKLYIRGVPLHVLNAIRRVSISEVPTMAVDSVVFTVNSSVFYDEIIAHRLGLIPLTSEAALEKYKSPEECSSVAEEAIFPEECFVKLDLVVSNPSDSKEPRIVYSKELVSSDPDVRPVYDTIPVLVLGPGQEVKLEAYARLGRGREHAKWSPVSVAVHKYIADISISYSLCSRECNLCVDLCPRGVLKIVDGKPVVDSERVFDCTLCRVCELKCPNRAIRVGFRKDEYIFTIESTGSLPPKRILVEATRILESKLDEFLERLREEGVIE